MKPFDPQLYADNDAKGRHAVKSWLSRQGCRAEDFFQYDVDLIVKRGDRWVSFIEVEVRSWNECKYQTIHVAKRKAKLLDNAMPTYIFVCTNNLRLAYYCDGQQVLDSPIINLPNKYMRDELFYDVPIHQWRKVTL